MIKFFRKIRQNMIRESKFSKYLLYATGEILLVVIGILIALQVNNWNENRNNNNKIELIYKVVQDNLNTDIENILVPVKFYEDKDKIMEDILTHNYSASFVESINEKNYANCKICRGQIGDFEAFVMQVKGFGLLNEITNSRTEGRAISDDLTDDIINFYTKYTKKFSVLLNGITEESYSNFTSYEQYPWYLDYMAKKYNHESVLYFTQNKLYKNKVATYKLLAVDNYLRDLKIYKAEALQIINRIEKRQKNIDIVQ